MPAACQLATHMAYFSALISHVFCLLIFQSQKEFMACHDCNATKKQPKGTSGGPPKSPIISAGQHFIHLSKCKRRYKPQYSVLNLLNLMIVGYNQHNISLENIIQYLVKKNFLYYNGPKIDIPPPHQLGLIL